VSDRSRGSSRERSIEQRFIALSFRTGRFAASGQHRGERAGSLAIDGDLIALAPDGSGWPNFIAEIGGRSKSVRASLAEMTAHPLPAGFRAIVVRLVDPARKRWRWHTDSTVAFDTLPELLAALSTMN
jgi:hypothetical protein